MSRFFTLKDKVPVEMGDDVIAWVNSFEKDSRWVDYTTLPCGTYVSTVFLGVDYSWIGGPPLLFETMIFGGPHDEYQERYSTWDDAEAGHAKAVRIAKDEEKQQ